jgi:prepilin-type N-terminal cleavage/methylation domain-containing protein
MPFKQPRAAGRTGFTLVELVVVMAIIVTVASIAALVLPDLLRSDKMVQGANLIQGILLNARQRAIRDQVPSGIRFYEITDPVVGSRTICNEMVYVQKPDDFNLPSNTILVTSGSAKDANADFSGGIGALVASTSVLAEEFLVQTGDYLIISGKASMITGVSQSTSTKYDTLSILNTSNYPTSVIGASPGPPYIIQRAPRRVKGEDSVKLPTDIVVFVSDSSFPVSSGGPGSLNIPTRVVNLQVNGAAPTTGAGQFFEIVFGPNGSVIGTNNGGNNPGQMIKIWVWDSSRDTPSNGAANYTTGQASYVVVSPMTGMITIQPVNSSGTGTYDSFTTDVHASGM